MNNMNMANMANMGGPVGVPMPMMNNGAMPPQQNPRQMPMNNEHRSTLNTYIYEYFLRSGMYECARALVHSDSSVNVKKDSPGGRSGENGHMGNGLGDDANDNDSKDEMDSKRPDDLPAPNVPVPYPDSCFLYEWFCLFWDMMSAQKGKGGNMQVNQYVAHTQNQARERQAAQHAMLRNLRPDLAAQQHYQQQMMRLHNGNLNSAMLMKGNQLQRTAMANNQNPQTMQMLQLQQKAQMPGNPDMDGNRVRPGSPSGADNAPSPSKRPRLDGPGFNQCGAGMPNGRPMPGGMPGQNQHHGSQMNKPMPNSNMPPGQGSPMVSQGADGSLGGYYNPGDMGPGVMRPGPGIQGIAGSNHALQDYQMQLMLLEQQNKKRLMMARQEQDINGIPRVDGVGGPGGPGGPPGGPNAQGFQGGSPPGGRAGASPNPAEQMKRNQQMNPGGNMGSPLPEGAQNRSSPNPINFMGGQMNPGDAPHFFKPQVGMDINMANAQMNGQINGQMRPPGMHPGQPFNPQMTPQMMAAARQGQQGGPPMQWQQPQQPANGQMGGPQGPQPQVQGTPSQRSMPPPSAPTAGGNNANSRNATSSPQTSTAAPPTPQQGTKANPKKKDNKNAKNSKKKSNTNLNSGTTPAAEPSAEPEPPTPATPITPVATAGFNKGPNTGAAQVVPNGQPAPGPAPAPIPPPHQDPTQGQGFMDSSMDFNMDFSSNPLGNDNVLNDFDFDSFLHDGAPEEGVSFEFANSQFLDGGEIGAE